MRLRSLLLGGLASIVIGLNRGSSAFPPYILMGDFSVQEEKIIEQVMDPILANYDLSGLDLVFIDFKSEGKSEFYDIECLIAGTTVHSSEKEFTWPAEPSLQFSLEEAQYLDRKDVAFIQDLEQINKCVREKKQDAISEQGYSWWINAPYYEGVFTHELSHLLLLEFPEKSIPLKKAFWNINSKNIETILNCEEGVACGNVSFFSRFYTFSGEPWSDEALDLMSEQIAETMAYVFLDLHYADWDEIAMQKINLVKDFLKENYSY